MDEVGGEEDGGMERRRWGKRWVWKGGEGLDRIGRERERRGWAWLEQIDTKGEKCHTGKSGAGRGGGFGVAGGSGGRGGLALNIHMATHIYVRAW